MIQITGVQEDSVQEMIKEMKINNEKIWTYYIAHLLDTSAKKSEYLDMFCGKNIRFNDNMYIGYEAQPVPPRMKEGNTHLDLAFGSIKKRDEKEMGIKYDSSAKPSFVCFVEAKHSSDCSTKVSNDVMRNQIVRVIENLLCFQDEGQYPEKVVFTLLTPRIFKENKKSRLYGYKMVDYKNNKDEMLKDM